MRHAHDSIVNRPGDPRLARIHSRASAKLGVGAQARDEGVEYAWPHARPFQIVPHPQLKITSALMSLSMAFTPAIFEIGGTKCSCGLYALDHRFALDCYAALAACRG
ncbi:hypothetical protein D3C86_1909640 [compost metagenome]